MQPYNDNTELTFAACRIGLERTHAGTTNMQFLLRYNDATTLSHPISGDFSAKIEQFQINKLYVCINGDDGVLALK